MLLRQAKQAGSKIIEINLERRVLIDSITDVFFQAEASERMPQITAAVKALREP